MSKLKSSETFKQYLSKWEKRPEVRRELKELKHHFKKDGWALSFRHLDAVFRGAGALFVAEILFKNGFRVRQCRHTGELTVVERGVK
jgi:hypothetical protein